MESEDVNGDWSVIKLLNQVRWMWYMTLPVSVHNYEQVA